MSEQEILKRLAGFFETEAAIAEFGGEHRAKSTGVFYVGKCSACETTHLRDRDHEFFHCSACKSRIAKALDQASKGEER